MLVDPKEPRQRSSTPSRRYINLISVLTRPRTQKYTEDFSRDTTPDPQPMNFSLLLQNDSASLKKSTFTDHSILENHTMAKKMLLEPQRPLSAGIMNENVDETGLPKKRTIEQIIASARHRLSERDKKVKPIYSWNFMLPSNTPLARSSSRENPAATTPMRRPATPDTFHRRPATPDTCHRRNFRITGESSGTPCRPYHVPKDFSEAIRPYSSNFGGSQKSVNSSGFTIKKEVRRVNTEKSPQKNKSCIQRRKVRPLSSRSVHFS